MKHVCCCTCGSDKIWMVLTLAAHSQSLKSVLGVVGVERGHSPNRRLTPQTPPGQSTPWNGRFYAVFLRKTVSDSHFAPNRKQKYGGHPTNELAATDFLFDFVYIMESMSTYILFILFVVANASVCMCVLQHVRTQRDAVLQSQSIHEYTGRP